MTQNIDDLLKIIDPQFKSTKGGLDSNTEHFNEFFLSFSSHGPLKITSEPDAPVPSYWMVTPHSSSRKVILFLHGGILNRGSTHGHQDLCQRISKHTGFSIFSADYHLPPDHPFPAAVKDSVESYLWLRDEGFKARELVIAGISSGGTLALSTLLALKDMGEELPLGGVCMSPVVDFKFPIVYNHLKDVKDWIDYSALEDMRDRYLQGQNTSNGLVSPIYGDLERLPPLLIQAGSRELLLCDINRFRDVAVKKEVKVDLEVWQGMFHAWQLFYSHLRESEGSLRSVGEFVKSLTK